MKVLGHASNLHQRPCGAWCRDIAPEGATLAESNAMLEKVVELAEHLQAESGKKVLWGTAQLFKHPRYMHGAATSEGAPSMLFPERHTGQHTIAGFAHSYAAIHITHGPQ